MELILPSGCTRTGDKIRYSSGKRIDPYQSDWLDTPRGLVHSDLREPQLNIWSASCQGSHNVDIFRFGDSF